MNATQRRVARRVAERQIDAEPVFLLEVFGRTFTAKVAEVGAANRILVDAITVKP